MADEILKIDANNKVVAGAITDDANQEIRNLRIDDATKGLKVKWVGGVTMGDVTGPNGATSDDIAVFDGTTGKIIKDSGAKLSDYLKLDQTTSQTIINGFPIAQQGWEFAGTTIPTAPASGSLRLYSETLHGFTRPVFLDGGGVEVTLSRDNLVIVRNTSGSTMTTGNIVYVNGSTGNIANVGLAKADSITTLPAIGMIIGSITDGNYGYAMRIGVFPNLNTSTFSTGDSLWVSDTTAGAFTNVKPVYPHLTQRVGSVLVSGVGNGSILVSVANAIGGNETGSIATSFTSNKFITQGGISSQFLKGDGSLDSTNYTPSSRILTINGTSYDLTADRSWSIIPGSGGSINVYLTSLTSSTLGTYNQLSYTNDTTTNTFSATLSSGESLIKTFIFDTAVGTTTIGAGTWNFNAYTKFSGAGNANLRFEIFSRTTGGTETTLFTQNSPALTSSYVNTPFISTQGQFTVNSTDKLGVRVYAVVSGAGSKTVSIQTGDNTATFLTTPLPVRHELLRDLDWNISGHTGTASSFAGFNGSGVSTTYLESNYALADGSRAFSNLTASKVVFTDSNKKLTSTGIGSSNQFIKGDGSLDSNTYLTSTSTDTLTNKRNNPRIVSATSYTTDTGTSLSIATADEFVITAQAGALKFNNPGGTPVEGNKLMIRIKDNGTAQSLTYDTQFRAMGNALPTTTVISKTMYMGFSYNATDTKWDLVALSQEQ